MLARSILFSRRAYLFLALDLSVELIHLARGEGKIPEAQVYSYNVLYITAERSICQADFQQYGIYNHVRINTKIKRIVERRGGLQLGIGLHSIYQRIPIMILK